MTSELRRGVTDNLIGKRVNTGKFGTGSLTGAFESTGEYVRYEVELDDPGQWSCSKLSPTGPFFALRELLPIELSQGQSQLLSKILDTNSMTAIQYALEDSGYDLNSDPGGDKFLEAIQAMYRSNDLDFIWAEASFLTGDLEKWRTLTRWIADKAK